MKLKKERWRNKGLWVAIAALVLMVLQDLGFSVSPERYNAYVQLMLFIFALLGIISDPNEGEWFEDKEE